MNQTREEKLFDLLSDGSKRTIDELSELTGYPPCSVSCGLRTLRKPEFGGFSVEKEYVKNGRFYLYFLAVLTTLFLFGCSSVRSGYVIGKQYTPAYSYVTVQPITTTSGNSTSTTYIPVTHYEPERFIFKIEGVNEDGEKETVNIYVPASEYEKYSVGDWYPRRNQGGDIK